MPWWARLLDHLITLGERFFSDDPPPPLPKVPKIPKVDAPRRRPKGRGF